MSILSMLTGKKPIKQLSIALVGPSKAGKTTFVRYLEVGKPVLEPLSPTLGIDIRTKPIELDGWKVKVIDTGGQEIYQQTFWELAIQQSDAVVFMIDATIRQETHPNKYYSMKGQFSYVLDIISQHVPLLILLNKQDLIDNNPLTPKEAITIFNDLPLRGRSIAFIPVSAKYGTGVLNALKWLITKIQELKQAK